MGPGHLIKVDDLFAAGARYRLRCQVKSSARVLAEIKDDQGNIVDYVASGDDADAADTSSVFTADSTLTKRSINYDYGNVRAWID